MATVFTDDNFQQEVIESEIPVLVDFWATWCGPCHLMVPIVEKLAEEFKGRLKIGKLDVEQCPRTSAQYGIMSIPAFKIFSKGQVIDEFVGATSEDDLRKKLEGILLMNK